MSQTFTTTGGARVGWTNASWPLAKLSATPEKLTLSIRLLGTYSFAPNQVSDIERYVKIPRFASGIRIRHCNNDCPQSVIFWYGGNPDVVLRGIHEAGFLPTASSSSTARYRGMAMRWSAIIFAIVAWNGLSWIGLPNHRSVSQPGPFMLAPMIFVFALSCGTLRSSALQRLVLKPGRTIGEIRPLFRLLAFVSGFLLIIFSILLASGAFNDAHRVR